ncbi:MAG: hypothetical protein ABIS06_16350 [Vicinamibacterales bacterium]
MLRVGSKNPLRQQIEMELGPVVSTNAVGHDGQIYYVIARDPFATGTTVDALLTFDIPRYRYRRILFPLLAGGFGQFSPRLTLFGLIFWSVAGMALMALAVADLAFTVKARGGAVMLAIVNLGALASVMLLTADVLALGLALVGVSLFLRRRLGGALFALTLAALTKEAYLLVPLALGLWQWRSHHRSTAIAFMLVPALPLLGWSVWVWFGIPDLPQTPAILGFPLLGVVRSISNWLHPGSLDFIQATFAIYLAVSFLLAAVMLVAGRNPVLRWVIVPWLILASCAGLDVWIIPSNAARAFAILWPLGILLWSSRPQLGWDRVSTRVGETSDNHQRRAEG